MTSVLIALVMVVVGIAGVVYAGIRHTFRTSSTRHGRRPAPGSDRCRCILSCLGRAFRWLGRASLRILAALRAHAPIMRDILLLNFLRGIKLFRRSKTAPRKLRQYLQNTNLPGRERPDAPPENFGAPADLGVLNCRARIGRQPKGDAWQSVLVVDICGTVKAPDDGYEVGLEISLADVTDDPATPLTILSRPKQGSLQGAAPFRYGTGMGRLCHQTTVLEDWTAAAQISPDWCVFPRQGHRLLQYDVAIVSRSTGDRLAAARCTAAYENTETGYLDVEDNIQRAKTLAVGLAFSVGAANGALLDPEIDIIYGWVTTNFGSADASAAARLELEQALRKTATFFRRGGCLNVQEICTEIAEIAPTVGRLDILDLCLRVAAAKGQVAAAELDLLKNLADWLKVERARLRTMAEKVLPVDMHQIEDEEMVLGVTNEMSKDEARNQLNREYAKWSSRVISSDPTIRKQADQMLNLIANARTQHVGVKLSD